MSERETQTPGPPIVDDQNAMSGDAKCPFSNGARKTHRGRNPNERKLVAQSTESEDPAPALATLQSHGRGISITPRSSRASIWMP